MLRLRIVRKLARALQAWAIGPPAIAVQSRINVISRRRWLKVPPGRQLRRGVG